MNVNVCSLADLAPGLGRAYDVGGLRIALFRGRTDEVYAVENECPHKRGPLADGMLIGSQIVCPLHNYRYEGGTGDCDQAGACNIAAFPAEVRGGAVYVSVPA